MINLNKILILFQIKNLVRKLFNDEWWFVATDIVMALTDSKDPSGYLKSLRRRDDGFSEGWGQIATPFRYLPLEGNKELIRDSYF
ncbi:MAG TPA: hypothetical protein PLX15_03120 [Candidatus Woesearchaeota archaeon]|nr:hypothetical protein [Candidatus Woesearchaeota archaeon]